MSLAERQLYVRFLRRSGMVLALISSLVLILLLRRLLGTDLERVDVAANLAEFVRFEGLAVVLAAPLGALLLLLDLKRTGVLPTLAAAGLGARELRRVFLPAALPTIGASAVLEEIAALPGARPGRSPAAWHSGDVIAWRPGGHGALVLFRADSLDVWQPEHVAPADDGGFEVGLTRSQLATPLAPRRIEPPRPRRAILATPPLSHCLRGRASLAACLGVLNRALVAGALVMACAYLALLVPEQHQWRAMIAYLFVVLGFWFASILLAIVAWQGGWRAHVAMGSAWLVLGVLLVTLHRAYNRRGLRIA